ncbi:glycosyltransferase [Planosporangium thailandense]|uniref:Glycosyltransferase n=1 Tax=Planosporangium thailandense TaxID=765197 RepID=A0ABX0XRG7_9ACTN|nr:glycosyltransferase [Planosporangium thailandense]NJC68609.1 glycosyltransferase [Planosporangium thailandense]
MAVATAPPHAPEGGSDLDGASAATSDEGAAPRTTGRVVIVSASIGAGHDGAAAELARQLRAAGLVVDRHDFVDILPGAWGRLLRGGYHAQLTVAPRTWGWLMGAAGGRSASAGVSTVLDRIARARMMEAIGPDPTVVLSTYPLASQLIGRLRQERRLAAPAVTFLTDMSVHPLWVAPGVDAHLALHRVPARQARSLGARRVVVGGAAVGPAFRPRRDAAERVTARMAFGLPQDAPLALVVAGSWGVGSVDRSARDIADTGRAVPVVVCGRNERLRARLSRDPRIIALGWVDDMPTLMRACDLVVQNAGGLTSLESLTSGVPVVTYRCLPGHGETNAAALEEAGWADWVRHRDDLPAALSRAVTGPTTPDFTRLRASRTILAFAAAAPLASAWGESPTRSAA